MSCDEKRETYALLLQEAEAVSEGLSDSVALMATMTSLIHAHLPYASWTGFYRVVEEGLLRVGPYQGPVACLEIPFHLGVCGAAARDRQSVVVPDVHAFPGHIACDEAARSEIVVPVENAQGELVAVLDVDSHQPDSFDDVDRRGLEALSALIRRRWTEPSVVPS